MKLKSKGDFALERDEHYSNTDEGNHGFRTDMIAYINFLKQLLTLGIFVPCDEDGNVLTKPKRDDYYRINFNFNEEKWKSDNEIFFKAKERVLFDGFDVIKRPNTNYHCVLKNGDPIWIEWNKSKTVEILLGFSFDVELTPTAIKQIGL